MGCYFTCPIDEEVPFLKLVLGQENAGVLEGVYVIENVETRHYLFQEGERIKGEPGDEGGWLAHSGFQAPRVVGADANYNNRALWRIIPQGGGKYLIQHFETQRYLLQDGGKIKGRRGAEGGWLASSGFKSPPVVGADANYYNLAYWKILPQGGGKYFIESTETQRYLFQDGPKIKSERGTSSSKQPVVGADANYYNRAYWRLKRQD
jgi:hypothetical protein